MDKIGRVIKKRKNRKLGLNEIQLTAEIDLNNIDGPTKTLVGIIG